MPNIKFLDSPVIISSFVGEKCLIFCVVSSAVNLAVDLVLFAWCLFSLEVVRVGIRKALVQEKISTCGAKMKPRNVKMIVK